MNTEKCIRDIMSTHIIVVSPEDYFSDVKLLFQTQDFHHVPVVGERNELLGIISKEDLWRTAYHISFLTTGQAITNEWYKTYQVKNIMTKNPLTIESEDTLGLAADIFKANKFRALPVVENSELVGIVTPYDLMQYAFNDVSEQIVLQ